MPDYDEFERRPDAGVIERAKNAVRPPAICLMVCGVISVLSALGGGLQVATGNWDAQVSAQVVANKQQVDQDPRMQPAQKQQMKDFWDNYEAAMKTGIPALYAVVGVLGLIAVAGGYRMMTLTGRGLAYFAAVLSMIPFLSVCCMGIPVGIWAIMALGKPEVKAGFAAVARASSGGLE